ncbi:thiamine pyrophosphate-dependent enzyme [Methanofollis fontis]|uniref:Thiamine pyrophosphate enzyme TPP-binding domain-containing protein n=1 Tax=Methanofollis fontis TaxID=2052832 RepID=A0A483CYL6_9EURY|nr:thiamine pyrophosphate-dependent enzyme [Methanofollis fontis]TAJ44796.1 hypothetical protein CUJ86_05750 [Methanofollis fontis]
MRILVLDTIHGGALLAAALAEKGHEVDAVDVYRGDGGITAEEAAERDYDLVAAPVHLNPAHPLLGRAQVVITHHEAVRMLLAGDRPSPMIEITGMQGKTTTAAALASVMPGPGILHTSRGTVRYPGGETLWRRSITPASALSAAVEATRIGGWCVIEESLGVSGAGDLAVLTSAGDYPIAGGQRRAFEAKVRSLANAPEALVPPGMRLQGAVAADEIAVIEEERCSYCYGGIEGMFEHPLLSLRAYREPLREREGTETRERVQKDREEWRAQTAGEADAAAVPLRPPYIMAVLSRVLPEDTVISVDVGENGWWFGRNFLMKPGQRFVMSGYLATMGFALPAAIAARLAYPERPSVCITGDGGFSMSMAEFLTAVQYDLPVTVILLNNHELGMIRVEQRMEHYPNFGTGLTNPDFAAYARSCGGVGFRVERPEECAEAVVQALKSGVPAIVDIETDPERF